MDDQWLNKRITKQFQQYLYGLDETIMTDDDLLAIRTEILARYEQEDGDLYEIVDDVLYEYVTNRM